MLVRRVLVRGSGLSAWRPSAGRGIIAFFSVPDGISLELYQAPAPQASRPTAQCRHRGIHRSGTAPRQMDERGLETVSFSDREKQDHRVKSGVAGRQHSSIFRMDQRFGWTRFYSEIADKLTQYRADRRSLISGLIEIAGRLGKQFSPILDKYKDGSTGPLRDVCPFTTIGCFNRSTIDETRRIIANEIGAFLKVQQSTPALKDDRDGIPLLNNLAWWYFGYEMERKPDDIDKLWQVFGDCLEFADKDDKGKRDALERSYNKALSVKYVGISKLTMGLFWTRPWSFPPLDKNSSSYIRGVLEKIYRKNTTRMALCIWNSVKDCWTGLTTRIAPLIRFRNCL